MGLCLPKDDIAYMVATIEAKNTIAAIDDAIAAWKLKNNVKEESD